MRQANPLTLLTWGVKKVGGCNGQAILSIPECIPAFLSFLFSGKIDGIAKNGFPIFHANKIAG
jgi:hypothetical protein